MSLIHNDMYKRVVPEEIMPKSSTADENSLKSMMLSKSDGEELVSVGGDDTVTDEDMHRKLEKEDEESGSKDLEISQSLDKVMHILPKAQADHEKHSQSLSTDTVEKEQQDWNLSDTSIESCMSSKIECSTKTDIPEIQNDDQGGDEETIATFVTAAGQQLALYAVEDSEEIFAVAVYDESGEPPTNFQFLMKADVERLIGEGAVRTVKKPTQIKKQLLAAQPSIFFSKTESVHQVLNHEERACINKQRVAQKSWCQNANFSQESGINVNVKQVPDIIYTSSSEHSKNIAYLMMDNCTADDQAADPEGEADDEIEIMEQSTVQYILFETDESESELTFDEVEATLQGLKSSEQQALSKRSTTKKVLRNQNDHDNEYPRSNNCRILNHKIDVTAQQKFMADRQELLDTLEDSPTSSVSNDLNQSLANRSLECTIPETAQVQLRTKRSRKQQLISVNREDSEIIIQPAVLMSEEDNSMKKQNKRRRKVVSHSDYHRSSEPKRMKRMKRKEVEIIEIDIDDDASGSQPKKDVVEITLDDNKDKYSSDKENEIIMVGDSDDESQQADVRTNVLQCQHCSRTFRQQRAVETHLRVCPKSPANTAKLNEQKAKNVSRTSQASEVKKQYACKICQEKFDVVVALARHVRSQHSQRKKRRFSKSVESTADPDPERETGPETITDNGREKEEVTENEKESETHKDMDEEKLEARSKNRRASTETRASKLNIINRVKTKRRSQRTNRSWEPKKLSCSDCGRWFPSAALLRAHYLQHETKKTEQRVRRCQICKKLIKSRLLYIRHLKMHSSTQQKAKSVTSLQKKIHATRPVTRKITSLRKRGRGRKL